jgi:hypothetical protein
MRLNVNLVTVFRASVIWPQPSENLRCSVPASDSGNSVYTTPLKTFSPPFSRAIRCLDAQSNAMPPQIEKTIKPYFDILT